MIYKATFSDTTKLLSLPETGLGYQLFEATIKGRSQKNTYCAYNGELLIDLDNNFATNKRQVFARHFSVALNEAGFLLLETNSISLIRNSQMINTVKNLSLELKMISESEKRDKGRYSGGKAAIDSPKENADGIDVFVRMSAYENDRRIDLINRKLRDGSFATTRQDYLKCVSSNDNPVDRYALPNDEKVKYAYYVQPKEGDILQSGIAQPAFGHQGGGREVYFEKGTSKNTYLSTRKYGE